MPEQIARRLAALAISAATASAPATRQLLRRYHQSVGKMDPLAVIVGPRGIAPLVLQSLGLEHPRGLRCAVEQLDR